MPYIEIQNLTKTFKKHKVLDDISLSCEQNTICGFVGVNGSGKTMLFRAICGLIRPDSGTVTVNGKVIGEDLSSPEDLGVIIENAGLWSEYSGFDNLKMLTRIGKKVSDEEIKNTIARVGLDPADKRPIRKYSLGMKQRIVFAQAIMEQPALLVLDEPTNALDEDGVALFRQILLEEKARGATILISSHNREDIAVLCDQVFHLRDGRLCEEPIKEKGAEKNDL